MSGIPSWGSGVSKLVSYHNLLFWCLKTCQVFQVVVLVFQNLSGSKSTICITRQTLLSMYYWCFKTCQVPQSVVLVSKNSSGTATTPTMMFFGSRDRIQTYFGNIVKCMNYLLAILLYLRVVRIAFVFCSLNSEGCTPGDLRVIKWSQGRCGWKFITQKSFISTFNCNCICICIFICICIRILICIFPFSNFSPAGLSPTVPKGGVDESGRYTMKGGRKLRIAKKCKKSIKCKWMEVDDIQWKGAEVEICKKIKKVEICKKNIKKWKISSVEKNLSWQMNVKFLHMWRNIKILHYWHVLYVVNVTIFI